jgi:2-polyprenyl-3-methyl-5-hydroxy-6-metoxy-1,4-benzoquinol methylase
VEPNEDGDEKWQPDVYRLAALIGKSVQARNVLDVGCGDGEKTVGLLNHFPEVKCLDLPHVIEKLPLLLRPGIEFDIEGPDDLPYGFDMVVVSDVIEHLPNPDKLLHKILRSGCKVAVVSTPERVAMHGLDHDGPPRNPRHVREWTLLEFRAFLMASGFRDPLMFITRSSAEAKQWATTVAVLTP